MKAVVSVDLNLGMGYKNDLLFRDPVDWAWFRWVTLGSSVVMGYNTFTSMGSRPLKNRKNYILTSKNEKEFDCSSDNVYIINNVNDAPNDSIIIGGAKTLKAFDSKINKLYLTVFDQIHPNVDTYFTMPTSVNALSYEEVKGDMTFQIWEKGNKDRFLFKTWELA